MKPNRIAVIGAGGFFGVPLLSELKKSFEATGTFLHKPVEGLVPLDISIESEVRSFFSRFKPDCVINLAAITDVDVCEKNPEDAFLVHAIGTKNLATACQQFNARFVYFSTDFVFDGSRGNYAETDSTNPINQYGKTKLLGELEAKKVSEHLIVRTSTPYSWNPDSKKFVAQTIARLSNGLEVNAFSDLVRSPTLVENVPENIVSLIKKDALGMVHLAGTSQVSMYEAALEAAQVFGFDEKLVKKTSIKSLSLPAPRPKDTSLNVQKAKKLGLRLLSLKEGLLQIKKSWEKAAKK